MKLVIIMNSSDSMKNQYKIINKIQMIVQRLFKLKHVNKKIKMKLIKLMNKKTNRKLISQIQNKPMKIKKTLIQQLVTFYLI